MINSASIKYVFGAALTIPLLPLLYFNGVSVRKKVPRLPEAKLPFGVSQNSSNKELTVVYLGESTIAGVGVQTHAEGFAGTLSNLLSIEYGKNIHWKVYAKSGYTVRDINEKIIPKLSEINVDLLIIGIGGNDAFKLNSPWKWKKDTRILINLLKDKYKQTPILFLNMPPIKEFPAFSKLLKLIIGNLVEILGNELNRTIKEFDNVYYNSDIITVANWSKKFGVDKSEEVYFCDGVHPSKITYQAWAKQTQLFISENELLIFIN